MLDKRGNSNTAERIALMDNFIAWFGLEHIDSLLADIRVCGCAVDGFLESQRNPISYQDTEQF
ncbi:hypothetical protein [Galbibacter sp.]|uniref:hypothetical protein n=1 Tax=Galbibacter sp. TaxID=2918471 RepID=UPI003A955243